MWNKRRDEEPTAKPAPGTGRPTQSFTPSSTESFKESAPMSTLPNRAYEPEMSRGTAVIGKSVVVKGQIFAREDLLIDGEVEGGQIEAHDHRLTIGPNGKVNASMKAKEIVIVGTVNGNVEATDKIDIRKDARLIGDIKTTRIVIEDGAYFKGSIDIQKAETKPATQPRTPVPTAEPPIVKTGGRS